MTKQGVSENPLPKRTAVHKACENVSQCKAIIFQKQSMKVEMRFRTVVMGIETQLEKKHTFAMTILHSLHSIFFIFQKTQNYSYKTRTDLGFSPDSF